MERGRQERGVVMVTALAIVMVLTTLGAAFLVRSLNESFQGHRTVDRGAAFYLAEAGVDQALATLSTTTPPNPAGLVGPPQNLGGAQPLGSFTIKSAVKLSPNVFQVVSQGVSQNEIRRVEAVISLAPETVFQFGMFGEKLLEIGGSMSSDSYDSSIGPYGGANKGHKGNLGTNGTTYGSIDMGGSGAIIDGQLMVGPNVSPPESIIENYTPAGILGSPKVVSPPSAYPFPPVVVPTDLAPYCTELKLTGQTVETLTTTGGPLGDNRYCYSSITLNGGTQLTASNDVIVYVTGCITTKGGSILGNPTRPSRLAILMNSNTTFTMETGNSQVYGAVYGPDAAIDIKGTADLFGSLVVETIHTGSSTFLHYDESLQERTDVSNQSEPTVISWRDLN